MNTNAIPSRTPYIAEAAPTSPMRQAIAGLIVSLASILGLLLGLDVALSPEITTALVSGAFGLYGLIMHRRARREQAAGVPLLQAARAEVPPVE